MLNKNERMAKLTTMGVNTSKYFTIPLENGGTVSIVIDENGNPMRVKDDIANQIIEDGYVRNTKLHRRFVMAQMFQGLNYKSYDGRKTGYNEWVKRHSLKYAFDMMLEEIRVLGKLEERDRETFVERAHFFTKDVIKKTMEDYVVELIKYVETLPVKNCKGVPYKRVKGKNIFVVDLDKKMYAPLRYDIHSIKYARSYNELYRIVSNFMRNMIVLPYSTPKSKAWIDAYKGEGAFYTLKNLVMFHDCGIITDRGVVVRGMDAVAYLNAKLVEYKGEGWRMFALMKKVIEDNGFDFKATMRRIYNN
jgi:hypothetical protein